MTGTSNRAGMTLIELLVAIVVLLGVLAIAGAATQRTLAVQSRSSTTDARRTALSDALRTLARHVASADASRGDLPVVADSVLELLHDVGMTTVCRAMHDTVVVTSGPDTAAWAATLPRAITTDDRLLLWHDTDERWVARRVRAATPDAGPCGDSSLAWPAVGSQQLVLDSGTAGIRPGVVVRVRQQERWSMVRGGDGQWSLSLATWDAARGQYTTPQPLLAPLSPPGARGGRGVTVRALDGQGRVLTDTLVPQARRIQLVLRMAAAARLPLIADSVRIDVSAR